MESKFSGILEFVMAVEQGSFTGAAEILGITGSAVGKSINKLEKRLGVQLLHRTTRRIFLTPEGEAWLVSCRRILEELDQIETLLSTENSYPTGRIRVDLPTTFGRRYIFPILLDLAQQYPQLDLSVTFQDRAVDMISEGVDLVVRIGDLEDSTDLIAKSLGHQTLLICASPAYLEKNGYPSNKEDLKHHNCLIGWRRNYKGQWFLKNALGEMEEFEINYRHEIPDGDALLSACTSSLGIAQLPSWLAFDALRAGKLISILPEVSGVEIPIHVLWQKRWHLQPKIRVVVDEITKFTHNKPELFLG
ncbi:LysR substrate binding domain protein [Acinetobacter calcoaceticus RUH2202]|uniref:LysR family transcriptional regulator n=1 Tax=Acinetobacter calcoaceticus TaxID=471 RepID=UPI0001BB51AA|nr:LysR family transcriptional regulator [Acinetobacter calcoaceticus]EEY78242.1 LysR substrate binding domain protein [Acinetobacter calcoaceticus RUH2202]